MVVCETRRGESAPRVLAAITQTSHGLKNGYITNSEEVAQCIRRAKNEAESVVGTRIKSAHLAIGTLTLSSTTLVGTVAIGKADGEITDGDIARAHREAENKIEGLANIRVIQHVPLEYSVDENIVPGRPQGMKGKRLEAKVLFIHALEQHIEDLIKTVESAGISVDDVVAAPLAAGIILLTKRQCNAGSMLIDIGADTITMSVYENSLPILIHTFDVGSHTITNAIALAFKLSLEESERIKKEPHRSRQSQEEVTEIIHNQISDFFKNIDKQLKKIQRSKLLPAGVIISGGGSRVAHIATLARETLSLPAEVAKPIPIIAKDGGNDIKAELDPSWGIAYGLCIIGRQSSNSTSGGPILGRMLNAIQHNVKVLFRQFLP